MLEPSNRLLKSLGLEAEGFDRAVSESRPKGGRLSRLIMERSEPDSENQKMAKKTVTPSNITIDFHFFLILYTDSAFVLF